MRLAARGLPALAPTLYVQIAQAQQRAGDLEAAWNSYEQAKQAALAVGPKNLADAERQAYYATLKVLGDGALAHNQIDLAIENYQLYSDSDRSGLETLRTLAELYERKGDVPAALRVTEKALVYSAKDPDLLQRKDRYYYSLCPILFAAIPTMSRPASICLTVWKGHAGCSTPARSTLECWTGPSTWPTWPWRLSRTVLRRGCCWPVLSFAAAKRKKPPVCWRISSPVGRRKWSGEEEEEGWYMTCRLLGDLYLQDYNWPDLAINCFNEYRKSSKSGADTLFKLGQAYEALGDRPRAIKSYEQVTSFSDHPLASQARDALYRLKT